MNMNKDIETFCNGIWHKAKGFLNSDGHAYPVYFVLHGGEVEVVPGSFKDDIEKEALKHAVTALAKKLHADAVAHISEAWAVRPSEGDREKKDVLERTLGDKRISEHPRKYEMLMLSCMLRTGKTYFRSATIIRSGDAVTLIDEKSMTYYDHVESYMIQPWGKRKKKRR